MKVNLRYWPKFRHNKLDHLRLYCLDKQVSYIVMCWDIYRSDEWGFSEPIWLQIQVFHMIIVLWILWNINSRFVIIANKVSKLCQYVSHSLDFLSSVSFYYILCFSTWQSDQRLILRNTIAYSPQSWDWLDNRKGKDDKMSRKVW